MLLDLSEIVIRDGMKVGLDVDQPAVEDPDLTFAAPIQGRLEFENAGDLLNIRGTTRTSVIRSCNRCLTDVPFQVQFEVDEHFPIEDVLHPNRPPRPGEEFDTVVSTVVYLDQGRPMLDLDELLRQLILTEIPIRTVCSDECAGLCPKCGGNRNLNPCQCDDQTGNSPLASLADLLRKNVGDQET